MARASRSGNVDDDQIFGHFSLGRDTLSRITEGSNEAGSVSSSHYFSVNSSAAPASSCARGSGTGSREFLTKAGALRLSSQATPQIGGTERNASSTYSSSTAQATAGGSMNQDPETLRKTVRSFVEAGVRGRRLEIIRRDGQLQVVTFKLSRHVDSFEIETQAGRPPHTINLTEVASVYRGDDSRAQGELAASLPGLDRNCAVVDLCDGRCLAFRFLQTNTSSREADNFAQCMQLFASEVNKERGAANVSGGHIGDTPR